MTPRESKSLFLSYLDEGGLDGSAPDPLTVWQAFKRFSTEPVECESDDLLFQAGDSDVQHDSYLDFCREFKLRGPDGVVWYEQIHAEFSAKRPFRLGYRQMDRWS